MRVFSFREARRNLAALLDAAKQDGAALVRHQDGRAFEVRPEDSLKSVLDVEGVDLGVTTAEIVATVREGRERFG